MAKPLSSFQSLVQQGWNDYLTHWSQTVQMTLWLLIVPVLQLGIMVVFKPTELETGINTVHFLTLIQAVVSLWIMVRVIRWYLSNFKNDPSYDHDGVKAVRALPSLIFASIIKSLAVMGGVMLLFFPGIWLAVLLGFTEFSVLEDGTRGIQALRASAALVKGRWWATFGRVMGSTVLFMLACLVVYFLLNLMIGSISGFSISEDVFKDLTNINNVRTILIGYSVDQVVASVIQAILVPLFLAWQIRLFHNLKETV